MTAEAGLPSLVLSYRNDRDAPASPDGFYRFGQTEWEDVDAAVTYARQHGAESVVLVGYSMGGGIVLNFLYQAPQRTLARAVILDAPLLDFSATVDFGARRQHAPALLASVGKWIAGIRFGVPWNNLDYVRSADRLKVPILLFHGDADETVPVEGSDRLAHARPDLVQYVRTPGALHVRSWNVDPQVYEKTVREFLARVAQPGVLAK